MERSAEFCRGAVSALEHQSHFGAATLLNHYRALLAAAEAREGGEVTTSANKGLKLAGLIDSMFYCEGGGYDSDDVREGIEKAYDLGVSAAREATQPTAAEVAVKA